MTTLGMEGLQTRVEEVAREVVAPHAAENDERRRFPKEAIAALGDAGLLGLTVPEQYGGMGLGHRAAAAAVTMIARADASVGMVYLMHLTGAACIAEAPEDAEVYDILHEIAAGRHLTTVAFSEKGSRSHFWSPVSRVQNGGPIRISAEKSFVTSANHADSYVVNTQATRARHPTESTLYLVDRASEGVEVEGGFDGLGLRANDSAPVRLRDVEVPATRRISPEGGGFRVVMHTAVPIFNLGSAAVSLGICRATVETAQKHLRVARMEHLGQSLGETDSVRRYLGSMQIQSDALAAFLEKAAAEIEDPGDQTTFHVNGVKVFGANTAREVTSLGMQACGGAGYSRHNDMERLFRDSQAATIMAPTTEVLEDLVGRELLELPWF